MVANFPTALDDDTSLHQVSDGVTQVLAAHHNNTKDAVKAIEAKIGIFNSAAPTSIDFRLGHPSTGHQHNAASGQGPRINASTIAVPAAGFPSGRTLYEHLTDAGIHSGDADGFTRRIVSGLMMVGTAVVGSNVAAPMVIGRTLQLESIQGALRRGPSGATAAFNVLFGPSHVYGASVGFRPAFAPGATAYRSTATPNVMTYPSGAIITLDTAAIGSNHAGNDLLITFIFRE